MIALVSLSVVGLAPLRHVTHATAGARFVTPRCTFLDRGMPSTPGWPVGRLNDLTNWAVSDVSELNFGAGGRWVKAGRRLPGAAPIADV